MAPLQLSNMPGDNLCYVNTSLQLLNSIPELSAFFCLKSFLANAHQLGNEDFPISSELCRLFLTNGQFETSAGALRKILAIKSGKAEFASNRQQDITEFLLVLLDELEKEYQTGGCEGGLALLRKFVGKDVLKKRFVNICPDCRYVPADENAAFRIMKLKIGECHDGTLLSQVVRRHYCQPDIIDMRCACVPPRQNSDVSVLLTTSETPDFLFIELRRYSTLRQDQPKLKTLIHPQNHLNLSNGEQFELLAIANHHGERTTSGHYTCLLNNGDHFRLCNDHQHSNVPPTSVGSSDNFLLLYIKSSPFLKNPAQHPYSPGQTGSLFVKQASILTSNSSQNAKVKEQVTKSPCKNCGKSVLHIFPHIQQRLKCQTGYDLSAEKAKHKLVINERTLKYQAKRKAENAEGFRKRHKIAEKKRKEKRKKENPEGFKKQHNIAEKTREEKRKREDFEGFKKKHNIAEKKRKEKRKKEDPEGFKKQHNIAEKTREEKRKKEDFEGFKKKRNIAEKKRKENRKKEDPEGFKKQHNIAEKTRKENRKKEDLDGFTKQHNIAEKKREEKRKKEDLEGFKKKHNIAEKKRKENRKTEDLEGFKKQHNIAEKKRKENRKKEDIEGFKKQHNIAEEKRKEKKKKKGSEEFRKQHTIHQLKYRQSQQKTADGRRKVFNDLVKFGPIFPCCSCNRLLFHNSVKKITDDLEDQFDHAISEFVGSYDEVPTVDGSHYLCLTCCGYLSRGKMPPMSHKNCLEIFNTAEYPELDLTDLEQCLIARSLLFMKIFKLPKSRMAAAKDRIVNIPVSGADVLETFQKLPKTPNEATIVPIKLKRKTKMKNTHKEQFVSVDKMKRALRCLKSLGHKYYQFIEETDLQQDYESRCGSSELDEDILLETPEDEIIKESADVNTEDTEEEGLEYYLRNDPVAKFQFDYNKHSVFLNNIPEIDVDVNQSISVAPGEGKLPKYILQDKDWDLRAFPNLDPQGKNGLNAKRKVKLTAQQFFQQRLFNFDRRFALSPSYLFAAVMFVETKQLQSNISIAFNRGRATRADDGTTRYCLDDPYSVLDNLKGTPRYFKKKKNEFISKLENLGAFHLFFTLSCADSRWSENFTSVLRQDHKVEYASSFDEVKIDGVSLEEFLHLNQSKHEFIRQNILTATRNFDYRVKMFIKTVIMSPHNPMHVSYYNYRVEFQLRGAGHIHGALWLDVKELEKEVGVDKLGEVLESIASEKILTEEEQNIVVNFADKFISVSLKDPDTKDIVSSVNVHHHTRACTKYGGNCRFNYPKFPSDETCISVPLKIKYPDENERSEITCLAKKILSAVKEVLDDKVEMEKLTERNDSFYLNLMDGTDIAYNNKHDLLVKARIIALLLEAGVHQILKVNEKSHDIIFSKYKEMLKLSTGGYKILHKRDIDEIFVNNYNPEWIKCWNGNLDLQIVLDHFAIITYITDYMLKDESGTMSFIKNAVKETENQSLKERLKAVKSTFQTHRQIGECEAIYRLFPSFHLSGSNIASLFVHSGFRQNRSKMLREVAEDNDIQIGLKSIIQLEDKPGKKYVLAISMEDRYDDRPAVLSNITLSQFCKRYRVSRQKREEEEDEDLCEEELTYKGTAEKEILEGDLHENFIISHKSEDRTALPLSVKIGSRYVKLRRPLALRHFKHKQTNDPHQYYFSQLRLYQPHSKDDLDLWEKNDKACKEAFENNKAAIQFVKSRVMVHQSKVEEAQTKAQEEYDNCVGDILDAAKEQNEADCREEGFAEPDDFIALDPENCPTEKSDWGPTDSHYKRIELDCLDDLLEASRRLDPDQRQVLEEGVVFAQNLKKAATKNTTPPKPPMIVVQGGAGCGKSFVINLMSQWMERVLRKPGDDPSHPYILRCALTGTAASNIDGQTIHNAFSLPFGNEFLSLSDKIRDERRTELKNLQVLILDEYSMVKADMLYQLDLRLKELKERPDVLFGGVAVFLFGDILQLRPCRARFIFEEPQNEQFQLSHALESHWESFDVINLKTNHRQGEDFIYSELLNRMRVGTLTDNDITLLRTRVKPRDDPDIPKDALYLTSVNAEVNRINEERLDQSEGRLLTIEASVLNKLSSKRKPKVTSAGAIENTPLQYKLNLKIGARVMLTYNLNTSDGLNNGALGELVGYEMSEEGRVRRLYVHFYNEKVGRERRAGCIQTKELLSVKSQNPDKLPTPIEKLEFNYSSSKKAYNASQQNTALQFPVKLAWAITGHKIQGQTVQKPRKLVADLSSVFQAAQAYVILSRIQCLNQLILVDDVYEKKIYPSDKAIGELEKMTKKAEIQESPEPNLQLISINIRSLHKHFVDLTQEKNLQKCDLVLVQQTCLRQTDNVGKYKVKGFENHFNSQGDGKGVAVYYNQNFRHLTDISDSQFQLSKFSSNDIDVINVYRSTDDTIGGQEVFLKQVREILSKNKKTIIIGDFNIAFPNNKISEALISMNFQQLVTMPSHIMGNIIDHCYIRNIHRDKILFYQRPKFYSDHDMLTVTVV